MQRRKSASTAGDDGELDPEDAVEGLTMGSTTRGISFTNVIAPEMWYRTETSRTC